ncbi:helix-turn-helix domain-containing protein [Altericroceibacterium endophyticum]|uniref:Helix-turn-helix domain-containing protein n=1 Tax=Altericroceibacterium endophyticum TaxID=1808508 RepID=A0A6I4T570_9SPHN|nr:helix-turn-helix domain-containing protein [Altericroceibacterium endophyticum]
MARHRVNPKQVKIHHSYTVHELAERLGVCRSTIRNWQRKGLAPIDGQRPYLFQGVHVRRFLEEQKAKRRQPCPPGTMYCLRCRQPREPALGMVDFSPLRPGTGNLKAICCQCGAVMHRRARQADLARIMPGITVQISQAAPRLVGCEPPSLNCDSGKDQ